LPLYGDSPSPHNVGAISPLDPQLFSTIDQHAKELVSGDKDARYSPLEVADWLDTMADRSTQALAVAHSMARSRSELPAFRQIEEDILILNALGRYYANLFRAALFYSLHDLTGDPAAASLSLIAYRKARDSWTRMAKRASKIYSADVSYGDVPFRRGHWADRMPFIDQDMVALEKHFASASVQRPIVGSATEKAAKVRSRPVLAVEHSAPASFDRGINLNLTFTASPTAKEAILWYRHVNQGERWLSIAMRTSGNSHAASIPGSYTNSPYPLQYYFELRTAETAVLHPSFNSTLSNQPYYAVMPVAPAATQNQ
jgi:hypothetical protein